MDFMSMIDGFLSGMRGRAKKTGKGLYDRLSGLLGGGKSKGYEELRPNDSENMDEPHLAALGSDYPEGEEAPIPRMPRTRAMQPLDMSDFLESSGLSTGSDLDTIRHKERLLRKLLRPGGLQYGPMR